MVHTAIQLFTLSDLEESIPESVDRVGKTTFDGVELYGANLGALEDEEAARKTRDALEENDLTVAATHARIDRLESSLEAVVDACEAVGCSTVVVPTYDTEAFETREGVRDAADRIADAAADLEAHGIDLLYHNHTFEFGEVDGDVAFEVFVDAADGRFGFQPDVGLATHAGYDALSLLNLVADQAPIVHLTDAIPEDDDALHADVGEGAVDVEACVDAAAENGAEWIVCENGVTDDPLASLEHGSEAFDSLANRVS